jgi:Holliday junction resolvasome RuvABC ATP-dependent DNA helicase subunit
MAAACSRGNTFGYVHEPYRLQEGFIARRAAGSVAPQSAYENQPYPAAVGWRAFTWGLSTSNTEF